MRSIHMFGADTAAEWQLIDQVGGSPNRFFQLAQRIAWGVTQPDLVRVDVIDTARRLVASHGTAFPAHLYDAWVWRVRDPERAERSLARACELATPDHPLQRLLPTAAEWLADLPAQCLVEVLPDRIWRVRHHFAAHGAPFHLMSTATIVRTASGELAIFNPVGLTAECAAQIRSLGEVRWLCSQGKAHSLFVEATRRQFPGSVALGTEGHLAHPPAAHLELDGILGRHALPAEFELIPIEGHLLQEVVVLHRPTATLISQDLVAHGPRAETSFLLRLYSFAFGVSGRLGFQSYAIGAWLDVRKLDASLGKIRDSGFTRFLSSHGPDDVDDAEVAAVRATLDEAMRISPLGHKLMLARYFATQPGFLRDMLRYLKTTKNAPGARMRGP